MLRQDARRRNEKVMMPSRVRYCVPVRAFLFEVEKWKGYL